MDMSEDVTSCKVTDQSQDFPIEPHHFSMLGTDTGREEVGIWGRTERGDVEHDLTHRSSFRYIASALVCCACIMETLLLWLTQA